MFDRPSKYDFSEWELHPETATVKCVVCGKDIPYDEAEKIGGIPGESTGYWVCGRCAEEAAVCGDCGEVADAHEMIECVGGTGEVYYLCSNCIGGERIAEVEVID